ncbi:hypothetical protein QYE76_043997 [Lolium multiflorum]|uniref:Polyprotein n=1 Tax=Lolium multiflorum TaxID=4521 RepID=A0AAD8WWK8_LOLMU|nr:hypothetical protein QYE76_043997 [Lolium multiflorum]
MAIFKAILEIRQHKSVELLCSEYSHIPHAEEDEDPTLNHLLMANKHPEVAAQHMDSCKSLLTTMYLLHMKMVGEIDHMLAEFTDPDKVQARMHDLRAQPQHTTPFFSLNNPVDWSGQSTQRDPLTPNFVPHYPHVSASYDSGYGGDNSWNLNCSKSPIENSTGWRFGEPFGDEEEPIPCDTGDESGGVNQYINRHYGKEEKGTDSISLDLEMGFSKPSQYEEGESSGVKKKMRGQVNRNPSWMTNEGVHPPEKVFTWEEFKKKFRDAHVPESVVELKKREFDELHQNTAPIMQYVRDFNRLSRYAPEEVDTEEKRKKRFMKGMNPYMKMQLRLARTAEFQELIDSAITFEDDYRQVQKDRRKRARIEPRKYPVSKPTPDRSFKPRFRPTGNQYNRGGQNQNPRNQILCHNCGQRGHVQKDFQKPRIICYGCGKEGHIKPECPNKASWSGQSSGGRGGGNNNNNNNSNRNYNNNNNNKRGKPYGKLNCTTLEQAGESDQAVLEGIAVNPSKVQSVLEWKSPKNAKEIRGFLGMAGYYRRFIEGFSKIAGPMTKLLKKNTPFVWTDECETSFQTLKEKLTTAPVLAVPEPGKDYTVYCDASKNGLGCVLMQDRKSWRQFLYGSKCELYTDHKGLKYFFTQKELNMRQKRWLELIKDYELTINYTPGKANVVADALSRKSTENQPKEWEIPKELRKELEEAQILLIRGDTVGSIATMRIMDEMYSDLKYEIIRKQVDDLFIQEEIKRIGEGKPSEFNLGEFDSLYFQKRICVPDDPEVNSIILKEAHETPYSIHPGSTKMYMDLKEMFWWNNMKREIAQYVSECHTCQRVKAEHQSPAKLLKPLEIPEWKWDEIGMDFVTGLPMTSKKKDMIWVIVDRLTKSAHFIPVNQKDDSEKLVNIYVKEIVSKHGVPKKIVSDRGSIFTSAFWKQLQEALGSKLDFSTAYHPQTGGQTERTNQILEDMLRACALNFGGSWEDHLPLAEFSYNNSYQSSIQMAPYEALYGRKCRSPICWFETGENKEFTPDYIKERQGVIEVIRDRLKIAQSRQKSYADQKRRVWEPKVGDMVYLKVSPMKGLKRFGVKGKLSPRYIGPFKILSQNRETAFELELPEQLSLIHNVFHVSQLRKCLKAPDDPITHEEIELQSDLTYVEKPEKILEVQWKKLRNRAIKYCKIQWQHHPEREATWETEEELRKSYPELFSIGSSSKVLYDHWIIRKLEQQRRRKHRGMEAHLHGVEKEEEQEDLTNAWKQKLWHGEAVPRGHSSCKAREVADVTPTNTTSNSTAPETTAHVSTAPAPAIMAYTFPKRTLRKVDGWLGDYEGPLTDLLCGMLKELHCETRIPVLKYIYYDGEIVAKCRVSVQLPAQLEMSRIMPYGEAKTLTTAFHMAIFKAILEIRQHKSVELLCSEYSHIPHAEEDEDPTLNHLLMANKHPEVAAQHMDSCKSLLTTMYLLHMKMVGEIDHMLAEFTDPDKVQARMHDLRAQPQHTTPFFSLNSPVDWSGQSTQRDPLTPNFVPHYPHVSASYDSGYGGDNSWNLNCSKSPIENSTGWRFGEPFGDEE